MNDEAKQTSAAPAAAGTVQLIAAIMLVLGGIVAFYVLKSRPEAWASWAALAGGVVLGVAGVRVLAERPAVSGSSFSSRASSCARCSGRARQETFTTTLVVLGFVVVASMFFWLLDLMLASVTKFFTGHR